MSIASPRARSWGVPAPAAVVSIFPAFPIDGSLPSAPLTPHDYAEISSAIDTAVGSSGANAFWGWLPDIPARGSVTSSLATDRTQANFFTPRPTRPAHFDFMRRSTPRSAGIKLLRCVANA